MTITELIDKAENILIIGHQRPDGDCIGAGLAVRYLCIKRGKKADFVFDSPVPEHFSFVPEYDCLNKRECNDYNAVICVDCADDFRTGKYIGYLKNAEYSLNIDHHKTNNRFAKENVVLPEASSTCEVLYGLLSKGGNIDSNIAYWLYLGLSTDTGHFMHNNTTPHVLKVVAELAATGIDVYEIASNVYKNASFGKVKLIARAINSMRFFDNGNICVISILPNDLTECNCVMADTEGIIDYGMMISSVKVAVCITEQKSMLYKVSYRSKGQDVAAAASVFGGGGHKLAAGCSVSGRYEDVITKVVKSITDGTGF